MIILLFVGTVKTTVLSVSGLANVRLCVEYEQRPTMKTLDPQDRALVVVLPARIGTTIDACRRAHDPNYDIVPPHITVVYPPFVPENQWAGLRPVVRRCLGQFRPFQIRLHGLGTFETDHHVLWLRVEDQGQLSRIQAALMQCLPQYVLPLPYGYVPHVTLGVFQSRSEMDQVQEAMCADLKPRRLTVRYLAYLSPDKRGSWCVCSRVPLGTGNGT
jgi:2'-5' RNA ligase